MNALDPTWILLLLLGGALVVFVCAQRWRRWRRKRAIHRRQHVAGEAERQAAGLLTQQGFEVEAAQAIAHWCLQIDGKRQAFEVRADYLVRRAGKRYVAEVKSGQFASRIETAATRRQLLEYRLAYPVDGVLLVDMERGRVRRVDFEFPVAARQGRGWLAFALVIALSAGLLHLAGWIALRVL